MVIYLASPYHSDSTVCEDNFKKVSKIAADLVAAGSTAISPITYGHVLLDYAKMPSDWQFWSDFCLTLLAKCDKLVVCKMQGWDKSRGVAEEIEFAVKNGIDIEYMDVDDGKLLYEVDKFQDGAELIKAMHQSHVAGHFRHQILALRELVESIDGKHLSFDDMRSDLLRAIGELSLYSLRAWIGVKESLPGPGLCKDVDIYLSTHWRVTGVEYEGNGVFYDRQNDRQYNVQPDPLMPVKVSVTHWMPGPVRPNL